MAVKKTKTGYQLQFYDADGKFRKRTFRGVTREEAVRLEREILAARERGERQLDPRRASTFSSFSEKWIEEFRSEWKPSTLHSYQQTLGARLIPAFGSQRIANITESQVRQFITRLQDDGLSARSINFIVVVLKMIIKTAERRRILRENPCSNIRKLKEPRSQPIRR